MKALNDLIVLARPKEFIKNLVVFFPLFFSLKLAHIDLLVKAFWACVAFNLVASAAYIFNDYHDLEQDKLHPRKKHRPLSAGKIQKNTALIYCASLAVLGLALSYRLGVTVSLLLLLYLVMNGAYSLKLKHVAIIDLFVVGLGFVIRIFVGGISVNVTVSHWIIMLIFVSAVFITTAKRRDDFLIFSETGIRMRKSLDGYNLNFINLAIILTATISITSYIMYTVSPDTKAQFNTDNLYLTSLFVMLGIFRFIQITHVENNSGSPSEVFLKDRFLQLSVLGWLVTFLTIIYFY